MAKLGSLFDGAGTFPYAAELTGMRPLWSSEIAPFPRLVTAKRLPDVVQLGDVTQVRGDRIAPVDVITFGSPCIVWENVPGALDSHGGEDFRAVLEAVCRAADRDAAVPRPPGGKWSDAGAIVGDGYSVAWRILDARFWGVPQRRRRIFLVGDFRGGRAPQVLFERQGLSRRFAESGRARQGTAGDFGTRPDSAVYDGRGNGDGQTAPTLVGGHNDRVTDYSAPVAEALGFDTYNQAPTGGTAPTLCARGGDVPVVCYGQVSYAQYLETATSATIKASSGSLGGGSECLVCAGFSPQASPGRGAVCYGVPLNFRPENCIPQAETASTLCNGTAPGTHNGVILSDGKEYLVRRLTPLECCRLQGMPNDWCAGLAIPDPTDADVARWRGIWRVWAECGGIKPKTDKQVKKWLMRPHSDSVEYEMWGNGIALPCALYVLEGIGRELEERV